MNGAFLFFEKYVISSVTVEFLLLNSSSCHCNSNPKSTSCGVWHKFQFQLMSPNANERACVANRKMFVPVYEHACFTSSFVTIHYVGRQIMAEERLHAGRRRNLNAWNWQAIAAPGPRRCSFFLPFGSFIISYTTAAGWWLSEDFVMNTPPAESLWDGLANQEMVGRSASLTDRKWCN